MPSPASKPEPGQGWKFEDLHFEVANDPPRYSEQADGPIQYVDVSVEGATLGFLWFEDAQDAADFVACASAGIAARNARGAWVRELLTSKSSGLSPSQAVAECITKVGNVRVGWIVPESLATIESPSALREVAAASRVQIASPLSGGAS